MDSEQIFQVQGRFARFHRLLVCLILIFNFERVTHNNAGLASFYPSLGAVLLLGAELLLLRRKNRNVRGLLALRYAQVLFTMFVMLQRQYAYTFATCLILLTIFVVEYYLTFDFVDNYYRIVFIMTVGIPMEVFSLFVCLFRFQLDERLFSMTFLNILYVLCVYLISGMYASHIIETNEQIFAQSRLIENVNETNEELRLNQEKVRWANEQLGEQKIKLEAAYKKINAVNSEIMIQNDIIRYIASSLDLNKLMKLITESILNEVNVDVCSIVLYPNATVNGKASYKIRTRLSASFREHLSEAIESKCFDEYLSSECTYVDNRVDERKYPFIRKGLIGSLIIVPLVKTGEVVGFLFVGHPKYDYFSENIGFFEGIAAQFIVALDNVNLYAQMEHMAIRDGLTGIYNRRHLTRLFNDALNEALVSRCSLTVALFDIDHFKNINDTYGHQFGDVVIRTIAELAARISEENDGIVGRYGGEEFVIIFPGKGLKASYGPVSELHEKVKELGLTHNGQLVHVNVSVGITSYPETCKNPSDLLNRADWAMYYSKQNGRDRITIDNDDIRELVMLK